MPSLPGVLVKKVYLQFMDKKWNAVQHIKELIEFCPNVEILSIAPGEEVEKLLIKGRQDGYLQKIRLCTLIEFSQSYARSCDMSIAFRDSLEYIYLQDGATPASPTPKQEYVNLYNKLMSHSSEMKHINTMNLKIFTKKSMYKLETYTNKFPLLNAIHYCPCRGDLNDEDEGVIQDLSSVVPVSKVTMFTGSGIRLTDLSAKYFMHKFPNVNYLLINAALVKVPTRQDTSVLSAEVTVQFFDYLREVEYYDVVRAFKQETVVNTVTRYMKASAQKKKQSL